jgi:hypothetical protein
MSLVSATANTARRAANTLRHVASHILPNANLPRLRALGRPHGATWLRGVMQDNRVERLSELPRRKVAALVAGLQSGAAI